MGRPLYIKLLTKWHDDPDWRSQSMEERLTFLYFLSLVEWSGDGCERGVVEYTRDQLAAREGVSTDKIKDWVKRWERLGTIERLSAGRRGHTNYSRARVVKFDDLYSTTTQARSASPVVSPVNHPVKSPVVSPVVSECSREVTAHAHPVKSPVVSPVNHPVVSPITSITRGSESREGEETRASARTSSLPGLESSEGSRRGASAPSPTSPAPASAAPAPPERSVVGVGPGAVERRWGAVMPGSSEFSTMVRTEWSRLYADRYPGRDPWTRGGNAAARDLMARHMHPLALETTPDEALDVFRAQVSRYLDMGGSKAAAKHPLRYLVDDWHDVEAEASAKRVDPTDPHGWANFVPDEFDAEQDRIFEEMMREQGVWNGK